MRTSCESGDGRLGARGGVNAKWTGLRPPAGERLQVLTWCLGFVVAAWGAPPAVAEFVEPLPTMAQVRAAAHRWSALFSSLRIKTRSHNRGDLLEGHPELASQPDLSEHWHVARDIRWSDEGLLLWEAQLVQDDRVVYRWAEGMGAGRFWRAETKRDTPDQERFHHLMIGYPSPIHPLLSYELIDAIHGLFNAGQWFFEDLDSPGFQVVGWEVLEGTPCVHVSLNDGKLQEDYWLDPSSAWIPRRHRERFRHVPEESVWTEPREWVALEMQQVEGIVFPLRGRFQSSPKHSPFEWRILRVEPNVPLSRAECLPPRQGGMGVIDYVEMTTYTLDPHGRRITRKSKASTQSGAVASPVAAGSDAIGVIASPPRSSGAFWFWILGIACLVAAGSVRFLLSRRTPC